MIVIDKVDRTIRKTTTQIMFNDKIIVYNDDEDDRSTRTRTTKVMSKDKSWGWAFINSVQNMFVCFCRKGLCMIGAVPLSIF